MNNLGVLALSENRAAGAVDYFRRSLVMEPRNAKTHYLLAEALDRAGKRPEARGEAARAVELDPSQPEFKTLQNQLSENRELNLRGRKSRPRGFYSENRV